MKILRSPHTNLFNSISPKSLALKLRGPHMSMEPSGLQVTITSRTWIYTECFHIPQLRKYVLDPYHVIIIKPIPVLSESFDDETYFKGGRL